MKRSLLIATLIIICLLFCNNNPHAAEVIVSKESVNEGKTSQSIGRQPLGFAFADTSGKRLLALDQIGNPKHVYKAVCNGKVHALRYAGERPSTPEDTGRATAANFDHLGGHEYHISEGSVSADTVCLLVSSDFLSRHRLIQTSSFSSEQLQDQTKAAIAKKKKRNVSKSWWLETLGAGRTLHLVLFARKGMSALVSIVLYAPDRLIFLDFPGSYEDESSVWRVDDSGELQGWMFDVIAAFESDGKIGFAYSWVGAEGANIKYVSEKGSAFIEISGSYKYHSPY